MAKTDFIYDMVRENILQLLEKGDLVWHKGWGGSHNLPRNYDSQRTYRGFNMVWLANAGHESPFWLTFRSAKEHGGYIKKGAVSKTVTYWKWYDVVDRDVPPDPSGQVTTHRYARPFYHRVFNWDDTEDVPEIKMPERPKRDRIQYAEDMALTYLEDNGPNIQYNLSRCNTPCYIPSFDQIQIPHIDDYDTPERYYSTLFHECIHSTGAGHRLNRDGIVKLTSSREGPRYSFEELVAEFGAAYLCAEAGVSNEALDENHAAYIQGWMRYIEGADRKEVMRAASAGQIAADFITGRKFEKEEEKRTNEEGEE